MRPHHHPVPRGVLASVAGAGFAISAAIASWRPVPDAELRLTEWINSVPDAVAKVLYVPMQAGTLVGPLAIAGLVLWRRRDTLHAATIAAAGAVTWFAAKGVKELFQRGRPAAYLPQINIREGSGTGLGFVSGHAAVAAAAAVCLAPLVPAGRRWLLAAGAGAVGVARVVFGVHLPADVVGGWAFGSLVGLLSLITLDRLPVAARR